MIVQPRRPGFTLVEILVVLFVVAILARIAMPVYHELSFRARAAAALGELQAIRAAAYQYHADTNTWPADSYPGELPVELAPYLGPGFSFSRDRYELDWENWILPDGTPKHPRTGVLIGISVVTPERRLGEALEALVGTSRAHYTLGDNYTFIIASR